MKLNDCAGSYKAYISLGSTCQTAYQLRRLGLRQFAGPLDWFLSNSVPDVVRLLRKRFNGLMEFEHLQLQGNTYDHSVVKDNAYDIVSFHDFPHYLTEERLRDIYPPFKEKLSRRIQRFLKITKRGSVLFVRTQVSEQEAKQINAALNTLMPREKFRLLIVNNHANGLNTIVHEDWGIQGVSSVNVPSGPDWKGSDQAWDSIMKGFKLYPTR